jgi:GTP-binding protein HflX
MLDKTNKINQEERAVLVGVVHKEQREEEVHEYLGELAFLAETAGAITVKKFMQKLSHPDSRTYVGKGKLQEIATYIKDKEIELLIFDDELTGCTNLEH